MSALEKLHSAIRWGKTSEEIEPLCAAELVDGEDERNGNRCIHIAAQNGHFELTKWLVTDKKCDVNAQNKKGQTALHMSVEYDLYDQTVFLRENGAKDDVKNGEGHEAITGIDGGKVGAEKWDGGLAKLKAANTAEKFDVAFAALESEIKENPDDFKDAKVALAQEGMKKKKTFKDIWNAQRFISIVQSLP